MKMHCCCCLLLAVMAACCGGCWSPAASEVIVYTSEDSEFSEPIFADFTAQAGVAVRPKFDAESTKTVGLAAEIVKESSRPQCDVFWNNEVLNTLRLERQGLLEIYRPAAAQRYPAAYRSPRATWYGFAARARVLVVNHQVVPKDQWPTSIFDLADGRWKGRTAMAKPLFGTTATHAACLFAHLGSDKAKDFFRRLKTNQVQIVSGNKQVALAVATGRAAFGITDTDDAIEEVDKGQPIEIVYPDQATGQIGTLFIPNTVAVIRGCPHPESARRLVDFLLSAETEAKLALGPSAQIPLGAGVAAKPRVETAETVRAMAVDFDAAAAKWDETARFLKEEFTGD